MNLKETVERMTGKPCTEQEAMNFANTQFGTLCAYVRKNPEPAPKPYFPAMSEQRAKLREKWNELNKKTPTDWEAFVEEAEINAHKEMLKNY